MAIKLIAIGRKHEPWVESGIERYSKRLKRPYTLEWLLLPHSSISSQAARQEESTRILARLKDDDFVILLDERGSLLDSVQAAGKLMAPLESSTSVVMIIGGAYGVSQAVHDRAQLVWSLSPLVFPHQLVRLIVIEQIYRMQEIAAGRPYHHV